MAFCVSVPAKMMKSLFFAVLAITMVSSARILDETSSSIPPLTSAPGTAVNGPSGATSAFGSTGAGVSGAFGTNGVIGGAGTTGAGASGTNGVIGGAGTTGAAASGTNGFIGGSGTTGAGASGTNGFIGGAGTTGTGASGTNGFIGGAGTTGAGASGTNGVIGSGGTGASGTSGVTGGAVTSGGAGAGGAVVGSGNELCFFMHDILGGSNPTAKLITGVVNNPAINGQIPFAKPNGAVLSVDSGVPTDSSNNALINNNNLPFLTGLSGTTTSIIQNNNGNSFINGGGNNNVPVVNGGQLAAGSTLQKLMFGTMTVIDDELTEGQQLGSGLVGRAQGFYVASSVDGTSNTMAFTALFQGGGYVDSLSFFGIHRSAVAENQLGVMGGTGKYVNAQGFATMKTYPASASSQNTDGLETLLQITVYLSY